MGRRFDRLILVPGARFELARVRTHPIAPKAIASTDFRHPGTVQKAGAGNGGQENPLSVPANLGGGLGNKENRPRHDIFVVTNIENTPRCLGDGVRGGDTPRTLTTSLVNRSSQ
jgi:hypothetical protein